MPLKLYLKPTTTLGKLVHYFFVGGAGAIVDIAAFAAFVEMGVDYRISLVGSFTLGTLGNFLLCNTFVFHRKSGSLFASASKHYLSSLVGLLVNALVVITLVELALVSHPLIAKLIAAGFSFLTNFLLYKTFAFKDTRM